MKYFSPALLDGSVTTAKLADDAVTNPKMANFSVNSTELFNRAVLQRHLNTTEFSLAGAVSVGARVDLVLTDYAFWPMIHTETDLVVVGHITDAPGAANARLGIFNTKLISSRNYDLDYRSVDP